MARIQKLRPERTMAIAYATAIAGALAYWFVRSFHHLLSHDVSWFLFGSERLVDGAALYRDIIDVNPPLIFYIGIPSAWFQHSLGWSDIVTYRLGVLVAIAVSLSLTDRILRVLLEESFPVMRRHLVILLAVMLTTFAASDFGQREHVMTVLALPYILLCSVRAINKELPFLQMLAVGCMAGVGIALKPHFLILLIAMELLLRRPGQPRMVQRIEFVVIVLIQICYYASILIFHPEYVNVLETMGKLYEAYNATWAEVVWNRATPLWLLSTALAIVMWSKSEAKGLRNHSYIAGFAFFVIAILQRKGWVYHFYPSLVLLSMCVYSCLYVAVTSSKVGMYLSALKDIFTSEFAIPVTLLVGMIAFDGFWSARKKPYADLIPYVERRAREEPIFVFSTSLTPAFPVVNYSHARWPWRFSSQWFLPGFYSQNHDAGREVFNYHSPAQMDTLERRFFNDVVTELIANNPVLVVSDTSEWHQGFGRTRFDFFKYYGQDRRFTRFIAQYVDQVRIGQYLVLQKHERIANDVRLHVLD